MITSIFSKSKPINFLIVFVFASLAFLTVKFRHLGPIESNGFVIKQVGTFFFAYFSILLLNFIASKNDLTQKNNFEIILYGLFLLLLPESLLSAKVIWANFFILLALRRLISVRSKKSVKTKLFDAAMLITISALFYFWALLFFGLIPVVLLFYSSNNIKHWLIPILGLTTIVILSMSCSVIFYNNLWEFLSIDYTIGFDFSKYDSLQFLVGLTLLCSFGAWSAIYYLRSFKNKLRVVRPTFKIVFTALIIAFVIVVVTPNKNGSEWLFMFGPLAIIITNYIEIIKENWFKEVFFSVLFLTPFILFMLQLFTEG